MTPTEIDGAVLKKEILGRALLNGQVCKKAVLNGEVIWEFKPYLDIEPETIYLGTFNNFADFSELYTNVSFKIT